MVRKDLDILIEGGSDIADMLVDLTTEPFHDAVEDELSIEMSDEEADDLLENIHSAVIMEVIRWTKKKIDIEKRCDE